MKMKKVLALLLAGLMTASLAACGGETAAPAESTPAADTKTEEAAPADDAAEDAETAEAQKLVVWTLAEDLVDFGEKFAAEKGVEVETVVIAPGDYETKVQTALLGGDTSVDIIVAEPQMIKNMTDAGLFANLDEFGAQDYAGQIVDYVWEAGKDAEGVQRAISYQITPSGFYYRRDIAEKVFGTSDPEEIGKLFADYATIIETGKTLKDAGYKLFASDAELNYCAYKEPWVVDGKLNLNQERYDFMDLCVALYQQDLTAYAAQWAAPWYQAMSGPVPILTADTQWGTDTMNVWDAESFATATEGMETTEVFAFGLPSWGVLTMRDNYGDTRGQWGVCAGPAYGFGGGTFIGISEFSEQKDLAWEFVQFCTLNEETAEWWIEYSEGDVVSLISVVEKHAEDENEVYGGQKLYKFWLEQAEGIDYSRVTQYDSSVGGSWGTAIAAVKTGEKTVEQAVSDFYDEVASTHPELTIER